MTRDEAKQLLPVMQAWIEGKEIQYMQDGKWLDYKGQLEERKAFRIKPEPKLRAWKPEEVPVGCWFRYREWFPEVRALILTVNETGITWADCSSETALIRVRFAELMKQCEHSTDNGKTWLPCGVMEEA